METNRREFLKKSALFGLAGLAGSLMAEEKIRMIEQAGYLKTGGDGKITLPALPYEYSSLEPFIDEQTMKIHHAKHHQGYIDKLNTASAVDFDPSAPLDASCRKVTEKTPMLVRNNLGGHYNHDLFWQVMQPAQKGQDNSPAGKAKEIIDAHFGSFEKFRAEFSDKAAKHFGSGWCWLVSDEQRKLKIVTTPNQDNPMMQVATDRGMPVLGLDVWEHAYYLKYQNKRADYINAWWNVVNWKKVGELLAAR
jgi:Fe-Mn family superoxide dismutase